MKKLYTREEQELIYNLINKIRYEEYIYNYEVKNVFKSLSFFADMHFDIALKDILIHLTDKIKMELENITNSHYLNVKDYYYLLSLQLVNDLEFEINTFKDIRLAIDYGVKRRKYSYLEELYILLEDTVLFQTNRKDYSDRITDTMHLYLKYDFLDPNYLFYDNTEEVKEDLVDKRKILLHKIDNSITYPKNKLLY